MTITLATLPNATAQEVFDQVARHLLTQKERSVADEKCLYRAPGGLKCAAGCLIGDDEYRPSMEDRKWRSLVEAGIAPGRHEALIGDLQQLHDSHFFQWPQWPYQLRSIAIRFGLDPAIVEELA